MVNNIKKSSLLLIIFLFTISCDKKEITFLKEVTFKTNFASQIKFRGTFKDPNDQKEYFYIADPVTHKTIKIFDLNGDFEYEIPLQSFNENQINIDKIVIHNKDSICVLGFNTLYLTNSAGIINETIPLKREVGTDVYTYLLLQNTNFSDNYKELLFFCDWRGYTDKEYKTYYEDAFYKPKHLKIKNIFDSKKREYQYGGIFYKNLSSKPLQYFEMTSFYAYKDKLYVMSGYSNFLFIYDRSTLQLIDKVKINSSYTNIGVKAFTLEKKAFSKDYHELYSKYGFINKVVVHDNFIYLVMNLNVNGEDIHISEYPFSIIKYDLNFNKVNEIAFKDKTYCGSSVLITNEGILMENLKKSTDEKTIYTLFTM
ncbi:hypothetical protein [Flavobacterium sp. N2270]|uniref:hypothetical protein n=1 Tax=Flavobacterium sp. N2270 TaxID=2986831 RepID=UPI002224CEA0|nr:hypothetical protein [Flavobacterium sp. N2270]